MLTKKQTFSDVDILLAFLRINSYALCLYCLYLEAIYILLGVFTEVLWHKMIQLLTNKTTPQFQLLPMSKVDQS